MKLTSIKWPNVQPGSWDIPADFLDAVVVNESRSDKTDSIVISWAVNGEAELQIDPKDPAEDIAARFINYLLMENNRRLLPELLHQLRRSDLPPLSHLRIRPLGEVKEPQDVAVDPPVPRAG